MSSPFAIVARAALIALPLAATTGHAAAQSRPSSTAMTCAQAEALVRSRGAIVLGTGGYTFDRYVAHRGFCAATETVKPAWVPARDTPQCFVGYTCVENDYWMESGR